MTQLVAMPGPRATTEPTHHSPRPSIHAGAWWLWAVGLAAAASRTTNVAILSLIAAVALTVVWACREPSPLDGAHVAFAKLAAGVIVVRMVLQVVFAPRLPGTVAFTLPSVATPRWADGISVGGPVTVESLLAGFTTAARLGVILLCVGAANTLTTPARLLKSMPGVLYEAAVAVSVAVSSTPQAIVVARRLRTTRRLRGRPTRGLRGLRGTALPVLEGALERSLTLAASMDARGYGRRAARGHRTRLAPIALLAGLVAVAVGTYGALSPGPANAIALPGLVLGALAIGASLALGSRGGTRTRYRPIPWDRRGAAIALAGIAPFVVTFVVDRSAPDALVPSASALAVPALPAAMVVAAIVALAPLLISPYLDRPRPSTDPAVRSRS